MATSFYSRTLPTPRVVSSSGATWLSLGFPVASVAQVPAEYLDGGGLGYLVQFQLQRTNANATIRLNLDTNQSGSGGAAGPEFINLFETRGLFRLTAGSVSRVFNLADATTGDTEEPYIWVWANAEVASEMREVVDALRVDDPPALELELLVPDGTLTVRAELGRPEGVRRRVGEAQGLSVSASLGKTNATIHGETEGLSVGATLGRPRGFYPTVAANGIEVDASTSQPDALAHPFAYIEYLHLEPLGVRSRTRSGGAVWEWNSLDLTIPYPVGDSTHITTVRVRSDQLRVTGDGNTLAGLGADFIRHGDLILYSPAAGEYHIDPLVGRFDSAGRIRLSGDEWDAWWTAFSADAANELTIEWFFHGLEPVVSLGRPEGVKEAPKAQALPLSVAASVSKPVVLAHAEGLAVEASVGEPRGYIPKVAAQGLSVSASVGEPTGERLRVGVAEPLAVDVTLSQPSGVRPAIPGGRQSTVTTIDAGLPPTDVGAVQQWLNLSGGDYTLNVVTIVSTGFTLHLTAPDEWVSVRLTGIHGDITFRVEDATVTTVYTWEWTGDWYTSYRALDASDRALTFEFFADEFVPYLAVEATLGNPIGDRTKYGDAQGIAVEASVGRPVGYSPPILGGTYGFLDTIDLGLPDRSLGDLSDWTGARAGAFYAVTYLSVEEAGGSAEGVSISAHHQTHAYVTSGEWHTLTLTANTGAITLEHSASVEGAGFGDRQWNSPEAIAWADDFLAQDEADQTLEVRLDGREFVPFLRANASLDDPRGYLPKVRAQGFTVEASLGMPAGLRQREVDARGFSVAASVGRPRGYLPKVRANGIAAQASVGMPSGLRLRVVDAEPLTVEATTGRARGYLPKVRANGITVRAAPLRANSVLFADATGFAVEATVGRPVGSKVRPATTNPLRVDASLGRPVGWFRTMRALPIVVSATLGRAGGFVKRAVRGLNVGVTLGRAVRTLFGVPITEVGGGPITLMSTASTESQWVSDNAVGGYNFESFNGLGTGYSFTGLATPDGETFPTQVVVSHPTAGSKTLTLQLFGTIAFNVGLPDGWRDYVIALQQLPLAQRDLSFELVGTSGGDTVAFGASVTLDRPRGFFPTIAAQPLSVDASVGEPRGFYPTIAANGIAAEASVGMAEGERRRVGRAEPLAVAATVGRARGYVPSVRADGLSVEATLGRPSGQRSREADAEPLSVSATVGRPRGYVPSVRANGLSVSASVGQIIGQRSRIGEPRGFTVDVSVGRPRGYLPKVRALALAAVASVGMPDGIRRRIGRAQPLAVEATTGRARGYLARVRALALNIVATLSRVTGQRIRTADARGISVDATLGRPRGFYPTVAARGVSVSAGVGRPRGYRPTVRAVGLAASVRLSRPIGTRRREGVAAGIAVAAVLGRPEGLVQARAVSVAASVRLGQPQRYWPRRRAGTEHLPPTQARERTSSVTVRR